MRVVDPNSLIPHQIVPIRGAEADEAAALRDAGRRGAGQMPMTELQRENFLTMMACDAADKAWLEANMPVGAVFDVLGVTHLVVAVGRERASFGRAWQARVARPDGKGGIEHEDLKVHELRARVEPGYTSKAITPPHMVTA